MANKNSKDAFEARQENIEQTVSGASLFLEQNKKTIFTVIAAVVVAGLLCLAYVKLVYEKQLTAAMEAAYPAEILFQNGEYELALNGNDEILGFVDIIADYGTKAGKSMPLYAGICEYNLGNYESALAYFQKYKGKEPILAARAKACEGDVYVALEDYEAAVKAYKAAIAVADNVFAAGYLLKEGLALEALGRKAEARECYVTIQEKYSSSREPAIESMDISRHIARVSE